MPANSNPDHKIDHLPGIFIMISFRLDYYALHY